MIDCDRAPAEMLLGQLPPEIVTEGLDIQHADRSFRREIWPLQQCIQARAGLSQHAVGRSLCLFEAALPIVKFADDLLKIDRLDDLPKPVPLGQDSAAAS